MTGSGEAATTPTGYGWRSFRADLIAGLTVAAVSVPQAMAYALIAGVDPRYGIYTAIVMTALGSLFGSSAHLINGPTNAISLVVFSAVGSLGVKNPEYTQTVFLLSLLVGGMQVLIYCFKLGDLTRFISESVILGFMLGAGILVALTQLPNLVGLKAAGDADAHLLGRLIQTLWDGDPDPWSLGLGLGTAATVIALRTLGNRLKFPMPDMLLALVLASLVAALLRMHEDWPPFPRTLPLPGWPDANLNHVRSLAGSALALAILGLLEAIAIAKSIAARTRQPLDCNRQCLAEGLANIGGGLFQCIPGSGSLTRSAINFQAGAVSRLSGILAALAVAGAVLLFADLAAYVPKPALAGILLVTAWRLVDKPRIAYCFRAGAFDRNILLATAISAVVISIEFSILIGVFFSFISFIPRASRLGVSELVLSKERVVRERRSDDVSCDRLAIVGLEGELFFGVGPELARVLDDLLSRANAGVQVVVLRLKRSRNPDMVCLELLQYFLEEMHRRGRVVLLCGVRQDVARTLQRVGLDHCLPSEQVFLEEEQPEENDGPALSSTLRAVKRAYDILAEDLCATCPRRQDLEQERGWYYMI